jgi:hypothetical protein
MQEIGRVPTASLLMDFSEVPLGSKRSGFPSSLKRKASGNRLYMAYK